TAHFCLLGNNRQRWFGPFPSYCTVSQSCQCTTGIPARILKNETDVKNPKAGRNASAWHRRCCAIVLRFACRVLRITERCLARPNATRRFRAVKQASVFGLPGETFLPSSRNPHQ